MRNRNDLDAADFFARAMRLAAAALLIAAMAGTLNGFAWYGVALLALGGVVLIVIADPLSRAMRARLPTSERPRPPDSATRAFSMIFCVMFVLVAFFTRFESLPVTILACATVSAVMTFLFAKFGQ